MITPIQKSPGLLCLLHIIISNYTYKSVLLPDYTAVTAILFPHTRIDG